MSTTAWLLLAAFAVGSFDVSYYHSYRFRLYEQPGSVGEELTHLARAVAFVVVMSLLVFTSGSASVRAVLLALVVVDLVVLTVDVLLEPRSRAPLGGLPTLEYLTHMIATFLTGAAAATIVFAWDPPAHPVDGALAWLGATAIAAATISFTTEALLFRAAVRRRSSGDPASVTNDHGMAVGS